MVPKFMELWCLAMTTRKESIFKYLVSCSLRVKSCVFYVYSKCVLESHIEILRREFLGVSPKFHTRTRMKSRVMGFG